MYRCMDEIQISGFRYPERVALVGMEGDKATTYAPELTCVKTCHVPAVSTGLVPSPLAVPAALHVLVTLCS